MSSTQEVGEIFGEGSGPAHAMLRSPTVLIAAVGLWGMNIYFFRLFGINYVRVLKYDLVLLDSEEYTALSSRDKDKDCKDIKKQSSNDMGMGNMNNNNNSSSGINGSNSDIIEVPEIPIPKATPSIPSRPGGTVPVERTASIERLSSNSGMLKAGTDSIGRGGGGSGNGGGDSIGSGARGGGGGGGGVDRSGSMADRDQVIHRDLDGKEKGEPYASDDDDEQFIIYGGLEIDAGNGNNDDVNSDGDPYYDYSAITWERLVILSLSLLFLLHSTYFAWIDVLGGGQLGAVFAFYAAVCVAIVCPFQTTKWLRKATVLVLQRSFELINPRCWSCSYAISGEPKCPRMIPFIDVFYADAMCSLSKVFFDWGMLLHMASHYPNPVPPSALNILMPSAFAAIPFCIRARQCWIMYVYSRYKNDPKRFSHLWNALKYSTSIFPLCLSAYQKTIDPKKASSLEAYLIFLLAINALYALYWDIVNDWGMMQNPTAATAVCLGFGPYPLQDASKRTCGHSFMRSRLRFGVGMSAVIVIADSILRFSWMLRFWTKLFPSNDSFVLCTQFLEIFRRALWNLLRVEWENLKQVKAPTPVALKQSSMTLNSKPSAQSSAANSIIPTDNDLELTSFLPSPPSGKHKG